MDNKKEEISLLLGLEQRDNLKNILADQPTLKLGQTWSELSDSSIHFFNPAPIFMIPAKPSFCFVCKHGCWEQVLVIEEVGKDMCPIFERYHSDTSGAH